MGPATEQAEDIYVEREVPEPGSVPSAELEQNQSSTAVPAWDCGRVNAMHDPLAAMLHG